MSQESQMSMYRMGWGGYSAIAVEHSASEFAKRGLAPEDDEIAEKAGELAADTITDIGSDESDGVLSDGGHMSGRILLLALKQNGALVEGFDREAVVETMRSLVSEVKDGVSEQILAEEEYVGRIVHKPIEF
jgi:hypothetical protein